jgi:hypothetical protein
MSKLPSVGAMVKVVNVYCGDDPYPGEDKPRVSKNKYKVLDTKRDSTFGFMVQVRPGRGLNSEWLTWDKDRGMAENKYGGGGG